MHAFVHGSMAPFLPPTHLHRCRLAIEFTAFHCHLVTRMAYQPDGEFYEEELVFFKLSHLAQHLAQRRY